MIKISPQPTRISLGFEHYDIIRNGDTIGTLSKYMLHADLLPMIRFAGHIHLSPDDLAQVIELSHNYVSKG